MKKRPECIVILVLLLSVFSFSQGKKGWSQYGTHEQIQKIISSKGAVWIATMGGGLLRLDTLDNSFTRFTNANSPLPSNLVYDICAGHGNGIWIATEEGLASFDGENWDVYTRDNSPLSCGIIRSVGVDENGAVWMSTGGEIYKYDGETWTDILEKCPGFPMELLSGARQIQCWKSQTWFYLYHVAVRLENGKWNEYQTSSNLFPPMPTGQNIGTDGTFWFPSTKQKCLIGINGNGTERYPLPGGQERGFSVSPQDRKCLLVDDTLFLEHEGGWIKQMLPSGLQLVQADSSGYLWLRAGTNEIIRYDPELENIRTFSVYSDNDLNNQVHSITVDSENRLWGINYNHLYLRNKNGWVQVDPQIDRFYSVFKVSCDSQGRVKSAAQKTQERNIYLQTAVKNSPEISASWTCSEYSLTDNFLYDFVPVSLSPVSNTVFFPMQSLSNSIEPILFEDGEWQRLPSPEHDSAEVVTFSQIDEKNAIWAVVSGQKLYRYNDEIWERMNLEIDLTGDSITAIVAANEDTVWIGFKHSGLAKFDGSGWKHFDSSLTGSGNLTPIYYDKARSELWSRSNRKPSMFLPHYETQDPPGLHLFDGENTNLFTPVNSGLIDCNVNSVAADENGLWIASEYGLSYWNRRPSPIQHTPKQECLSKVFVPNTFQTLLKGRESLTIKLDQSGRAAVSIYNLSGRLVKRIETGLLPKGKHRIHFSRTQLAHGIFLARVKLRYAER